MYGTTNTIRRAPRTGGGVPYDVAIDLSDEVPDPGDTVDVYVQAVDAAKNGLPIAGAVVAIEVAGDSVATLADTTLTTDAGGGATTTFTVDAEAPIGSRFKVDRVSVTWP